MGINAEREITSHGLAINCNTEMKWFGNIVPCGIADKGIFSLVLDVIRGIPYYKSESLLKSLITCIHMHENPKIKHQISLENEVKCWQTLK